MKLLAPCRWVFRAPYSVLNSSDVDTGKGSRYGAVNCNTSVVAPGTPNLKYAHAPMLERLPNGSLAAAWQVLPLIFLPFLWNSHSCPISFLCLRTSERPSVGVFAKASMLYRRGWLTGKNLQGSSVCFDQTRRLGNRGIAIGYQLFPSPLMHDIFPSTPGVRPKLSVLARNCHFTHWLVVTQMPITRASLCAHANHVKSPSAV